MINSLNSQAKIQKLHPFHFGQKWLIYIFFILTESRKIFLIIDIGQSKTFIQKEVYEESSASGTILGATRVVCNKQWKWRLLILRADVYDQKRIPVLLFFTVMPFEIDQIKNQNRPVAGLNPEFEKRKKVVLGRVCCVVPLCTPLVQVTWFRDHVLFAVGALFVWRRKVCSLIVRFLPSRCWYLDIRPGDAQKICKLSFLVAYLYCFLL